MSRNFFFREITETEDSLVVQARELNTFPKIKEGTIIGHLPTVQIILELEVGIPEVDIPEVNIPEPDIIQAVELEEILIIVLPKKVIPNILVQRNLNIILISFPVFPEVQGEVQEGIGD